MRCDKIWFEQTAFPEVGGSGSTRYLNEEGRLMRATKERFLALLRMELEDMKEDLAALMKHCAAQKEQGEISEYVYRENMAVYENLHAGVGCLARTLAEVEHDEYPDIPSLITGIEGRCREQLTERVLPGGMAGTLKRKMEKITTYLQSDPA